MNLISDVAVIIFLYPFLVWPTNNVFIIQINPIINYVLLLSILCH